MCQKFLQENGFLKTPPNKFLIKPECLFQAQGPKDSNYPNTFKAYQVLTQTYLNCFEKAASLELTHITNTFVT